MAKLLLVIGAVLALTVGRSDGTVTLTSTETTKTIGRTTTAACQITGETFVGWETPSKETITLSTTGRKTVTQNGDTYTLTIDDTSADDGGDYYCKGSVESKKFTLYVNYVTVGITLEQTLHLGKTETLNLGVSAYPKLTYTWTKDGQPISFTPGGRLSLNPNTGSITFSPVKLSDQGNYTCTVVSAKHEDHSFDPISATVLVTPKINKYEGDPVRRTLTQGYNNTFHCDIASGSPKPTVTWYFGWTDKDKKVDSNYDSRFSHPSEEEWTITGVVVGDKGKYRCIAENSAGTDELKFWITDVDVAPKIDPPLTDITVNEGTNQNLVCKVSGTPSPSVEWQKNGVRYHDQSMTEEGGKVVQTISFTNIQWVSSGNYTCTARNGALDNNRTTIVVEQTISLNVNSPPRIIKAASPTEVYSFVGYKKAVTVACVFSGYPAPLVKMMNESSGQEVARGNSSAKLTLRTISTNDFGKFNCSAENSYGMEQFSVELKVAVPPGPPRNLFANKTCKAVTLNWEQPTSNGGLEIFQYNLKLTAQDATVLLQRNLGKELRQKEIDYNNFAADTSYIVYLKAQSDAGHGQEEMLTVKTKKYCVPGRPTITKLEAEVETSFTLTWNKPDDDGGDPNIKYKVEWRKKPIDSSTIAKDADNIGETSYRVTGLEGGAEYEFKVFAKNSEGYSEADTRSYSVKRDDDMTTGGPDKTHPTPMLITPATENKHKNAIPSAIPCKLKYCPERDAVTTGITTFQTTSTPSTPSTAKASESQTTAASTGDSTILITTSATNTPKVGALTQSGLGTGAIAGIVVAVILIVLITIDLFCCFFNSCGIIFCCHQAICGGGGAKGNDKYKDGKATEMEKKPLPENV